MLRIFLFGFVFLAMFGLERVFAHSSFPNSHTECERLLATDSSVDGTLNMKAYFRLQDALQNTVHRPRFNSYLNEEARAELGLDQLTFGEQLQIRLRSRWGDEEESVEVEVTTRSARDASEKFINLWIGSNSELFLWTPEAETRGLRMDSWRNLPRDGDVGLLFYTPRESLAQRRFLSLRKKAADLALLQMGFDLECEDLEKVVSSSEGVRWVQLQLGKKLCRVPIFEFEIPLRDDTDYGNSF